MISRDFAHAPRPSRGTAWRRRRRVSAALARARWRQSERNKASFVVAVVVVAAAERLLEHAAVIPERGSASGPGPGGCGRDTVEDF